MRRLRRYIDVLWTLKWRRVSTGKAHQDRVILPFWNLCKTFRIYNSAFANDSFMKLWRYSSMRPFIRQITRVQLKGHMRTKANYSVNMRLLSWKRFPFGVDFSELCYLTRTQQVYGLIRIVLFSLVMLSPQISVVNLRFVKRNENINWCKNDN